MDQPKQEMTMLQQLMYLRAMTIRTGSIHEAQALQLRNYGLLIPGVKSSVAKVDTERKIVTFCLTPKAKSIPNSKSVKVMCGNISVWTKQLLWPNTTVVIECDKKVLYDSRS